MASSTAYYPENVGHGFGGIAPRRREEKLYASSRLFDVFINHKGDDVKETLAQNLYTSLGRLSIEAFLDSKELEFGGFFPDELTNAIRSASVHIAIFSKGYAESAWCLAELDLMLKTKGKFIPVFYDVEPSELRHIEKGVYSKAFTHYEEESRYPGKLKEWKEALQEASFITGDKLSKHNNDDDMLCQSIISAVREELNKRKPLHVADNPVGLDKLVENFEKHSSQEQQSKEKIKMVGIWGMGGCGKTTLAAEFFNRKRSEYNASCFLSDVDKADIPSLQYKLLRDLIDHRDPQGFETVRDGRSTLEYHLKRTSHLRFLIVLDDIDRKDQIDDILFRDVLNSGGLVIVTTRYKRVLIAAGITVCYDVKEMDPNNSRELFCWHAFRQPNPKCQYEDLVEKFMKVCGGLPLSLRVFGLAVSGRTDQNYWHSVLNEAGNGLHEDIKRVLKKSFDALSIDQKQIFMDSACFFIDEPKSIAKRIWELSGWRPDSAFQTLKEKCLVDVIECNREEFDEENLALTMNCHHRDLGTEMAKDKDMIPPRRLWRPQDHEILESRKFPNIITEADARSYRFLHSFNFRCRSQITCFVGTSDDSTGTTSLIWLKLDLKWQKQTSIPPQIPLQNVRCLRIVYGILIRLWNKDEKAPSKLKELLLHEVELECTKALEKLTSLEKLVLRGRHGYERQEKINAVSLSNSLRKLSHLKSLSLMHLGVDGVVAFSNSTSESPMENLENIQISEEKHVRKVSISGNRCPRIKYLHLESMENLNAINLSRVTTLNFLTIDGCKKLQDIPGIEQLQTLKRLNLSALGHGGIRNCINRLQGLPSEFTTLIGRAANEAASSLTEKLFSDRIGADASIEFHINENGIPQASLNTMPHSLSAIIVCAVVQCNRGEIIQIPLPPADSINRCIAAGEWIVTLVGTAKSDWISRVSFGGEIKKGCIAMVKYSEEGKTLPLLKRIVGKLYES